MNEEATWECPGEAHELDNTFNPGSQGPYGPGYHECDVCDNEFWITEAVYLEEIEWQAQVKEWREEAATVRKLLASTQVNVG